MLPNRLYRAETFEQHTTAENKIYSYHVLLDIKYPIPLLFKMSHCYELSFSRITSTSRML